jgi:hypothetical protein
LPNSTVYIKCREQLRARMREEISSFNTKTYKLTSPSFSGQQLLNSINLENMLVCWRLWHNDNNTSFFFFLLRGCPGQLARTSTNPTGPEVNDHVSLQWPWGLWDSNWWPLGSKPRAWPVELHPSGYNTS